MSQVIAWVVLWQQSLQDLLLGILYYLSEKFYLFSITSLNESSFKVYLKAELKADDIIATVTFGGPRVGRRPFKEIYDKMIPTFSFHFRNPDGDPVSDPKSKESYYESRNKG